MYYENIVSGSETCCSYASVYKRACTYFMTTIRHHSYQLPFTLTRTHTHTLLESFAEPAKECFRENDLLTKLAFSAECESSAIFTTSIYICFCMCLAFADCWMSVSVLHRVCILDSLLRVPITIIGMNTFGNQLHPIKIYCFGVRQLIGSTCARNICNFVNDVIIFSGIQLIAHA